MEIMRHRPSDYKGVFLKELTNWGLLMKKPRGQNRLKGLYQWLRGGRAAVLWLSVAFHGQIAPASRLSYIMTEKLILLQLNIRHRWSKYRGKYILPPNSK
jgi:hypothetical protein